MPGAAGRCYNVGCGRQTTLNQLLQMLGRLTDQQVSPAHAEGRAGDIRDSVADISRIQQELGFEATVGVEQGLGQLLDYERSQLA